MLLTTKPTHLNVECDECGTMHIKGVRYKCGNCKNYDLCAICFEYTTHNKDHTFLVIKRPLTFKQSSKEKPLLKRSLYETCDNDYKPELCTATQFITPSSIFAPRLEHASGPVRDRVIATEYNQNPFGVTTPHPPCFGFPTRPTNDSPSPFINTPK